MGWSMFSGRELLKKESISVAVPLIQPGSLLTDRGWNLFSEGKVRWNAF